MLEDENDMNDLEHLADTGWKQMHEMLREHGLSNDQPVPVIAIAPVKRNWFPILAASVLFVLIFSFPFILNDKFHSSLKNSLATESPIQQRTPLTITQSVTMISPVPSSNVFSSRDGNHAKNVNTVFIDTRKEAFTISLPGKGTGYLRKVATKEIEPSEDIKNIKSIAVPASPDSAAKSSGKSDKKKSKAKVSKKIQFYAGAGINVSAWSNNKGTFGSGDINIHPGIGLIIPLSNKLSLHTGLWAFSTVRGKEASSKERELINNMNASIYYNVNTTSIIKASYFDVPVTLHYAISQHWSVGSGLQVSKLYKLNIREQQESYDYNNTRFSATVQQYVSTPTQAAIVLQKKAEIKKYEARFVAETCFKEGKWLLSAGYYYGLGKTITLIDADKATHQYRNEYLKLGIQYRIGGK